MDFEKKTANIKVIGVGGGGGNMIVNMLNNNINTEVELIQVNTDIQVLNDSNIKNKVIIGKGITKGLGAGMKPEVGREAAMETLEEIKKYLNNTDMVFIAAGLGGGTGTGAAPVIAKLAKEMNILTVSIVTIPFGFEGNKRKKLAMEGLKELKENSDSLILIKNDKLLELSNKNLGIKDAFKLVDNVLLQAVSGITEIILNHSENDINLDFADVQTIMRHKGDSLIGIGESENEENSAVEALEKAINSPLLEKQNFKHAKGMLVHFTIHPNYPLFEIQKAMDQLEESCNEEVQIIFGTTTNIKLTENQVKIILVANGFEEISSNASNNTTLKTEELTEKFKLQRNLNVHGEDLDLDTPTWFRNQKTL